MQPYFGQTRLNMEDDIVFFVLIEEDLHYFQIDDNFFLGNLWELIFGMTRYFNQTS